MSLRQGFRNSSLPTTALARSGPSSSIRSTPAHFLSRYNSTAPTDRPDSVGRSRARAGDAGRANDILLDTIARIEARSPAESGSKALPRGVGGVGIGRGGSGAPFTSSRPTFKPNMLYNPGDVSKQAWDAPSRPPPRPPLLGPSAPLSKLSDPFHILSLNPHDETLNTSLTQAYLSQMGKIKSRAETGLTWKNQRRVGKAIRRARAMGLISRWSCELPRGGGSERSSRAVGRGRFGS